MKTLNENAKKWVAALKSGKYRQAKEVLHKKGAGYCCLGVACDLYAKEHGGNWEHEPGDKHMLFMGEGEELPYKVRVWLGLKTGAGDFSNSSMPDELVGDKDTLAELNDSGKKFKTIAKIIESMPKGLFFK